MQPAHVGLVHKFAAQALRQTVAIDRYPSLLCHVETRGKFRAARANGSHRQTLIIWVIQAHRAKIDRQAVLEALQHDAEYARGILALPDCVGDVLQEAQAAELRVEFGVLLLDLREHVVERIGQQVQLFAAGDPGAHGIVTAIRDGASRLCKRQYRGRDLLLQTSGNQIRHQRGHHDDEHRHGAMQSQLIVDRSGIRLQI